MIKTYFSDKVWQFGKESLCGHVLRQNAPHGSQNFTSGVDITHRTMITLTLNHDNGSTFDSSLQNHDQFRIIQR